MNQLKLKTHLPLAIIVIFYLSSCRAIGGIFKAGIWVGIIGVVIIIAIILLIISKMKK